MKEPELSAEFIKSRLKVGEAYSYRQMTNLLCQKYVGGRQKILQLEKFKNYMDLRKIPNSHKYVVEEIYDDPDIPFKEARHDSLYIKRMEAIILVKLLRYYDTGYNASVIRWLEELSIIKENYILRKFESKDDYKPEIDRIDIEEQKKLADEFFQMTYNRFYTIFFRALESMKKRDLIEYRKCYYINVINPKDRRKISSSIADDRQESIIHEIENTAANTLNTSVDNLWFGLSTNIKKYKTAFTNAIATYNLTDDAKEHGYIKYITKVVYATLNESVKKTVTPEFISENSLILYMVRIRNMNCLNQTVINTLTEYYKKKLNILSDKKIQNIYHIIDELASEFVDKPIYNNFKQISEASKKIPTLDEFEKANNYFMFYTYLIDNFISLN